jgi:hypothetical protein
LQYRSFHDTLFDNKKGGIQMPRKHMNAHVQQGCVGCIPCEGGVGNIIRNLKFFALFIFTCGIGLVAIPFFKKCVFCGHSMMWNQHTHGGE